jgi:hypothetical protein
MACMFILYYSLAGLIQNVARLSVEEFFNWKCFESLAGKPKNLNNQYVLWKSYRTCRYTMPVTACGTHCYYLAVRFISFTHLCVGIPNVLLSGFQTKIVYAFHILCVCVCLVSKPFHPPWFSHIDNVWWSVYTVDSLSVQLSLSPCYIADRI